MDSINNINKLTKNDFISIFGNVFEKSNWIAEKVYLSIPFNSFAELKDKLLRSLAENENLIRRARRDLEDAICTGTEVETDTPKKGQVHR